ncbi:MAG: DNA repair protein RecO [Gammaproteobacteria bacterium]|nr:DNA repair protein RecO [Gammaproteobacteria bacterium]
MTPVVLQPAFVIHRRDYRESSFLLEALTRDHGRVSLVCRGARRKPRISGELQPFQPLLVSWTGSGELHNLTSFEPAGAPLLLTGDNLYSGFYINEITLRMVGRGDADPALFAAYNQAIRTLAMDTAAEPALRIFEKRLLEVMGYALSLAMTAHDRQPVTAEAVYEYLPEQGPMRCETAAGGLTVHGATLLALDAENLDDPRTLLEAKRLMRALLRPHLGPKPLRSRALFRTGRDSDED